jgi:predicted RNase H-like nuclease (RuvC/YqgF family)
MTSNTDSEIKQLRDQLKEKEKTIKRLNKNVLNIYKIIGLLTFKPYPV